MDDVDESIWQKILKLRDMADPSRGASEAEIQIATAKMNKLLLEHNLSLHMLDLDRPTHGITHTVFQTQEEAVSWELALLKTLADHNFCRVIGDDTRRVFVVVGKPMNIQATWDTYLWLSPQMVDIALQERNKEQEREWGFLEYYDDADDNSKWIAEHSPARWVKSYLSGMVIGLAQSLKRSRWETLDTADKRAIVPVMDKEVDDYLEQHFTVTKSKDYTTNDEDVFRRGKSAGMHLDPNKRASLQG